MISMHHVSKVFNRGKPNEVIALEDVSLQIDKGEFVVIIGANGSGKTTLLNIIGGAEIPSAGSIEINGTDVTNYPNINEASG
jgi:putative ABC transport system ATP-binding protein